MLWILFFIVLALLIYKYGVKPSFYWKEKGIAQNVQVPIFGDFFKMTFRLKSFSESLRDLYFYFPTEKVAGIFQFNVPTLMIRDPEIIKKITVKDFDHFVDRRAIFPEDADEIWSKNLVSLTGQRWRDMRATLSPSFTSSKMKMMFTLMSECAQNYVKKIERDYEKTPERDMKIVFTKYANDVIATTTFGIPLDSYEGDNEFYIMGRKMTNFQSIWVFIKFTLVILFPNLCSKLGIYPFPKESEKFFENLILSNVKDREEQNITRPDMINLLIEAKRGNLKDDEKVENDAGFATVEESEVNKKHQKQQLTDRDIVAQAFIFFFAGFDSISTMLGFVAYELAVHPDCQDKLREEIDEVNRRTGGNLTYDALAGMKYLDMVVSEGLRLWPIAVGSDRKCTKNYKMEVDVDKFIEIQQGDIISIPIFAIHRDPRYYPNPDMFDPERFSDENKSNISQYTYLPFGVGPRNCIGSRFALLEMKVMLFQLLSKMELVPSLKTPIPIKISAKVFMLMPDPGFFMDIIPRKKQPANY